MAKRYRQVHRAKARRKNRRALLTAALVFIAAAVLLAVWLVGCRTHPKEAAALPAAGAQGRSEVPSSDASPIPRTTSGPTPEPTPNPTPTPEPTPAPIADDGTDGYLSEGLYLWNNQAFELFYGSSGAAHAYAAAVSSYREQLPDAEVYNMVVPNHSEFGLPQRIRNDMGCTSQRENTSDVYESYTADVKAVDIYDVLDQHKEEYLYFNTDTHWAPLGAYYAYTEFCRVSGAEAAELSSFSKTSVEGFTGYLYAVTGESSLAENPDRIDLYEPGFSYTASLSQDGESFEELSGVNAPDEGMGYSMILWGDNPCVRIVHEDSHTGRKLALVKDSYGNAIAPFLAASFDEVYVLDFRSFPGSLPAYCAEQGVTDVLFLNNVMSANTESQIETMDGLFP